MDTPCTHIPTSANPTGKIGSLDGLRGLMAFNVVLCHFVCVYYPQMYYLEYAEASDSFLRFFATTPLSILINGNIAVQYFFVLTGFLIGRTFFTKSIPAGSIPDRSLKRYFRLLPIVCAATAFTFLTMRFDLQWHLRITNQVANTWFLPEYCNFTERLISLPTNIFINPFTKAGSDYVGPFWTIRYEFWGYILSMILCLLFQNRKYRYLEYPLAAALLLRELDGNYAPFLLGVLVADLQYNQVPSIFPRLASRLRKKGTLFLLALLGGYLASCPIYFTTFHAWMKGIPYVSTGLIRAIGVASLLFVLLNVPSLQRTLSHPVLLALGKLSFEVYAFHWPVMLSFQAWAFSRFLETTNYHTAAVSAFILSIPVIYLLAWLFHIMLAKFNAFCIHCKAKATQAMHYT